jgi:isoamylase
MSNLSIQKGYAKPLGIKKFPNGYNFSLYSKNATAVTLLLYKKNIKSPFQTIHLSSKEHKTGDIWHVFLKNINDDFEYSYILDGTYDDKKGLLFNNKKQLLDPYAKKLTTSFSWGTKNACIRGKPSFENFDWENIKKPKIPKEKLIIYEMHVRGFTKNSKDIKNPGTFSGIVEKIPYLKKLGINAIELLPIFEFDELNNTKINSSTKTRLFDYWGYNPINFFCPMKRYASKDSSEINDFKSMVKALHKENIIVILDVVFNHTKEGNNKDYYLNFRGIDNPNYYLLDSNGNYLNYSGCGNTFSCNSEAGKTIILESLKYWQNAMQVDGFRFDLASILTRDEKGVPSIPSPLLKEIEKSSLKDAILIAEPWDAAGLYQLGSFAKHNWSEWNDKFRDHVKQFIQGIGSKKEFFDAMNSSGSVYNNLPISSSINYITSHDGFSLYDLTAYSKKQNFDNAKNNLDGMNNNFSFNCNEEGKATKSITKQLRTRQMKNFFMALFLSKGIPMLLMGDEYGHSKNGNNNSWCHDNQINYFQWDLLKKDNSLFNFINLLINCRNKFPLFTSPCTKYEILKTPIEENNFLGLYISDKKDLSFLLYFNASNTNINISPPKSAKIIANTYTNDLDYLITRENYLIKPFSSVLLKLP